MSWIWVPSEEFYKEYNTYVIAYCLDTDEFFVTNQRYWWWQYQKEFSNEQAGINYFENHLDEFFQIANELRKRSGFYSLLKDKDLYLSNTNRFYGRTNDN